MPKRFLAPLLTLLGISSLIAAEEGAPIKPIPSKNLAATSDPSATDQARNDTVEITRLFQTFIEAIKAKDHAKAISQIHPKSLLAIKNNVCALLSKIKLTDEARAPLAAQAMGYDSLEAALEANPTDFFLHLLDHPKSAGRFEMQAFQWSRLAQGKVTARGVILSGSCAYIVYEILLTEHVDGKQSTYLIPGLWIAHRDAGTWKLARPNEILAVGDTPP